MTTGKLKYVWRFLSDGRVYYWTGAVNMFTYVSDIWTSDVSKAAMFASETHANLALQEAAIAGNQPYGRVEADGSTSFTVVPVEYGPASWQVVERVAVGAMEAH